MKSKNIKFNSISDFMSIFDFNESQNDNSLTQNSVNDESLHNYDKFVTQKSVINESFEEFMGTKSELVNSNKHFMYSNKNNFCSGYFPDFITLDSNAGYNFSKGNNYPHYYLYTKNNKYLKPLSSSLSKYNNKYFDDLSFAYKVSKMHSWGYKTNKKVNLFKDSYLYKKHKRMALRDTGRRIPENMNKSHRHDNYISNNNNNSSSCNKKVNIPQRSPE